MQTLLETLNNPTEDNLYSLKALHQASGGLKKDNPNYWLRSQSVTTSIKYLESKGTNSGNGEKITRTEKGGNKKGGDTFVCRKLVYSYAMWISDEFHFMVIDTFDQLLNAATTDQVLDVKFNLDNTVQQDFFSPHQQPRDKNTLQVIMQCTPFQAEQFHNELICDGLLEKIGSKTITQRILGTTPVNKMVTGKKGDTLLWDAEQLKQYFVDKQTDWTK